MVQMLWECVRAWMRWGVFLQSLGWAPFLTVLLPTVVAAVPRRLFGFLASGWQARAKSAGLCQVNCAEHRRWETAEYEKSSLN